MKKNTITAIALILLTLTTVHTGYAQDSLAGRFKAVLVQLRSEHNRIEAMTNDRRPKELEMVKKDAINVASRMIADFKDNFTYCPVYYYMDTNLNRIEKRDFNGVLLNADGTQATNLPISDTSTNYLIVFYGYPTAQSRVYDVVKDSTAYANNSGEPFGKGLIINNYKFLQVSFLYKFGYDNGAFKMRKANKKYIYNSKRFEMEYYPFATLFNEKLLARGKKIEITRYNGVNVLGN